MHISNMNTLNKAILINFITILTLILLDIIFFTINNQYFPLISLTLLFGIYSYIYFSNNILIKTKKYSLSLAFPIILLLTIPFINIRNLLIQNIIFLMLIINSLYLNRKVLRTNFLSIFVSIFILFLIDKNHLIITFFDLNNFITFSLNFILIFLTLSTLIRWYNKNIATFRDTLDVLEQSEEKYKKTIQNIQDGLIILGNNRIEECNDIFANMVGCSLENIIGERLETFIEKEHYEKISKYFLELIFDEVDTISFETNFINKKNNEIIRIIFSAAKVEFFSSYKILATLKDITIQKNVETLLKNNAKLLEEKVKERTLELEEANKKLNDLIQIDGLTKLYNYKFLTTKIKEKIDNSLKTSKPLSIILLDLDHFKLINDNFGHLTGDEVLIKLGKLMKNIIGNNGYVGRYGGEEFLILLPDCILEKAVEYGELIRKKVEKYNFEEFNVTISGGIATFSKEDNSYSLIDKADKKLYEAKKNGRNKIIH
ncbi:PAS domain S-box-containing protein/diguanylate cyclase (GGDEF)-like protein [Hypnocyclicus thermotrophus]|uniref:PAS domain S-box-containing protein/diguanylate cyclase (GGDEF)-like protein n=1 Tax=Hypnocyclicus thermotrophus TaxID=1627895 RepID=A0AA46DXG4_9FUSO|nr:sensor domain-containing diguanylate cyclase [Hypnocyclicus thermotrophus]TDT68107.1 PAS domain S-box-containing protein/diguanylate cyclase (GGDEF)-like protein [Hypnocyclicus thermotrophus]